jgi:diguanylate cyclase (GGDEF)-like protein
MFRQLTVGNALLIVLMAGLVGHAVWHIAELEERMRDIVDTRNRKIQLATDLQEASYNRHNSLVYQVLARDAFERDDSFQLYIKWGYQVGKARNELKALPLDAFEHANLTEQDRLVAQIIVQQEEISDLAARELLDEARERMAVQLRPLNLQYVEIVESLRRHERDLIRGALERAQQASRQAVILHLALGGALILLAVFISVKTRRILGRHARTIDEQMQALEKAGTRLEHEATHDALTGLANRALFYRRLQEAIIHAGEEGFLLAVMYVDLDNFKDVNDVHGHAAGDDLLRAVACRLRQVVRKSDTAARLGGDEFALLFVGLEMDNCPTLCTKVERAVGQPVDLNGVTLMPAGSIGYAIYPRDSEVLDDLLSAADARMYEVKRARKQAWSDAQAARSTYRS